MSASPAERWQALLDSSPHIHPFDDDEIGECIKIDLKDLPILRKNGWQVGSNQFLLHGFYNYHHLLMGRLSSGKEDTFVFGVPGIFDVKEQFRAGMFGFSAFKPARNSSETAGVSPRILVPARAMISSVYSTPLTPTSGMLRIRSSRNLSSCSLEYPVKTGFITDSDSR